MENLDSFPVGFFFPNFEEISFAVSPLAIHPYFTLKMFKLKPQFDKNEVDKTTIINYGWELFEKLTEIHTFEYHYLMTYHLENIVNKREWIENFILLISCNKDLFISRCGVEKYAFLYEMVIAHYSAFNNAFMSPLSNSCEDCRNRIITNLKHDVDFIEHLDGLERNYFCSKLKIDYRRFEKYLNLKIDPSELDAFKEETDHNDIRNQLKGGLIEETSLKGLKDLSGLKQIEANCTTGDCAKLVADFLNNTTDDDGEYVFDFNNSNLSEWLPKVFHCKKGKTITASSYRDKLPSQDRKRQNTLRRQTKR